MHTDSKENKMVRYYIKTRELIHYWLVEDGELVRRDIPTKQDIVYLDILGTDESSYMLKVKLYLEDGVTINCLLPHKPFNRIHLSRYDDLFDGRFNA